MCHAHLKLLQRTILYTAVPTTPSRPTLCVCVRAATQIGDVTATMPRTQPCCSHDHDCEATECGVAYSLYKHVNLPQVRALSGVHGMYVPAPHLPPPWTHTHTP